MKTHGHGNCSGVDCGVVHKGVARERGPGGHGKAHFHPPKIRIRMKSRTRSRRRSCAALAAETPASNGNGNGTDSAAAAAAQIRVAVLAAGPSPERGISLNSARAALDAVQDSSGGGGGGGGCCSGPGIVIEPVVFVDLQKRLWTIPSAALYSNTPDDFDFKLDELGATEISFAELRERCDVVLPLVHGPFGEDGQLQHLLEQQGITAVGSSSAACHVAFDKYLCSGRLQAAGIPAIEARLVAKGDDVPKKVAGVFSQFGLDEESGTVVIKPAAGGSSIGVGVVTGVAEGVKHVHSLLDGPFWDRAVIEPFIARGVEFTVIVFEAARDGQKVPVALMPTEVDPQEAGIFDYRRKYLPSREVRFHTPPKSFELKTIQRIRRTAEQAFATLGLRDYARLDGWVLDREDAPASNGWGLPPAEAGLDSSLDPEDGRVVLISDVNIVSGMEQASFLFQQAAEIGMAHNDVMTHLLTSALRRKPGCESTRLGLDVSPALHDNGADKELAREQEVFVLFGGGTSERQVSLMSGLNVWLKLLKSPGLLPRPFLLSPAAVEAHPSRADLEEVAVYQLPYAAALRHTVEEVVDYCESCLKSPRQVANVISDEIVQELNLDEAMRTSFALANPDAKKFSLKRFCELARDREAIVFVALHGGVGEDGQIQAFFDNNSVRYTGSGPEASALAMDKAATGEAINAVKMDGLSAASKRALSRQAVREIGLLQGEDEGVLQELWDESVESLGSSELCIKPVRDGCSTGVALLQRPSDLLIYCRAIHRGKSKLDPDELSSPHGIIELPPLLSDEDAQDTVLILEPFIRTDAVTIETSGAKRVVSWNGESRWIELTTAVVGAKDAMRALTPSLTLSDGSVLSLQEKFQGGTGVNMTPPPPAIMSESVVSIVRERIERASNALGLEGFARIDYFAQVDTGEVIIIEANTVPGMTPSTVLFHQGLKESPPLNPTELLAEFVELAAARQAHQSSRERSLEIS